LTAPDKRTDPALEFDSGHQHPPAAFEASDTDVRAKPDNLPLIAAAGMGFAHAHDVPEDDL
jgi:hypothetical protein